MSYPIDQQKRWQYTQVPNLLGGLNLSTEPDSIELNQALTMNNVLARKGVVTSDTGYDIFGATVSGIPQATHQFDRRDLTSDLMLITTTTLYKWDIGLDKWLLVRGTAGTTTTQIYYAGTTVIHVADATGFSTGDLVGLSLDDGSQLQTTITVSGLFFTLAAAIPVGRTSASGASVVRAVTLTGDLDHQVMPLTIPGSDWMVFTNGVNIVKRYDGTDCVDVPNLPSAGDVVCKSLALYNTALFLLNTAEGGILHAQRIRRSDQTDPTNWTTGTAGFDDLLDLSDPVHFADILGPYLIVYRERSIARGSFIGQGGVNYFFESMVTGEGAISSGAVTNLGESHIIVGHTNIYEYLGDYSLKPVGDRIFSLLFGFSGTLHPAYRERLFTLYIEELDEVWILYPSVSSTDGNCDSLLRYNVGEDFWYTREFADRFCGYGFFTLRNTKTWSSLEGDWTAQAWAWNSKTLISNADVVHLCSATAGQVYEYDFYARLDNATQIPYTVETKDFAMSDAEFRFDMLEMNIKGTSVLLEYSVDSGTSWEVFDTITQSVQARLRIYKQIVTNKIRFRWTGTSSDFALSWFGFSYKIESLY